MTAVPEAAFLGWTEMREETEAMEDRPGPFPGLEHAAAPREEPGTLLDPARQLLFLLQEDEDDGDEDDGEEDEGDEDDVLETGDDDGEEGLEETDFGDNDEEDVEEAEHEVEMTIEFDPCS